MSTLTANQTYTLRVRSTGAGGAVHSAAVPIRAERGGHGLGGGRAARARQLEPALQRLPRDAAALERDLGGQARRMGDDLPGLPHGARDDEHLPREEPGDAAGGERVPGRRRTSSSRRGAGTRRRAARATSRRRRYANADNTGACQACHTRTSAPDGTARYRNTAGAGERHNATEACSGCHGHATGFEPAGKQCKDCHLSASADVDSYAWNGTGGADQPDGVADLGPRVGLGLSVGEPGGELQRPGHRDRRQRLPLLPHELVGAR